MKSIVSRGEGECIPTHDVQSPMLRAMHPKFPVTSPMIRSGNPAYHSNSFTFGQRLQACRVQGLLDRKELHALAARVPSAPGNNQQSPRMDGYSNGMTDSFLFDKGCVPKGDYPSTQRVS